MKARQPNAPAMISALAAALLLLAGSATAADLFKTGEKLVNENEITVTNNLKYVNYVVTEGVGGETIPVTLTFSGSCPINPNIVGYNGGASYASLGSRVPNGFTPKGVTGLVSNVDGTTTSGTVTFDLTFNTLKQAGKSKAFGVAHLDLTLAVDDDCDSLTDPIPMKVGVQVSASTASHP